MSYKIRRRLYVEFGYKKQLLKDSQSKRNLYNITPWLFNKLEFDRIYLSYSFKHDIAERFTLNHEFEYENFFPAVQKYHNRFIYSGKLAYTVRRSGLAPFIENQLHYYSGGDISNGIKRYRFKTGASFKPIKDFGMSTPIYCHYQNEFKTEFLPENDYSAFGNRYATSQIEGYVPKKPLEVYDILGQGGVIGEAVTTHKFIDLIGTAKVELLGYVADEKGDVQNTINQAEPLTKFRSVISLNQSKIILSLGTSMDSGKTSTIHKNNCLCGADLF